MQVGVQCWYHHTKPPHWVYYTFDTGKAKKFAPRVGALLGVPSLACLESCDLSGANMNQPVLVLLRVMNLSTSTYEAKFYINFMFLIIGIFFPYKNFTCPLVKKKRVKYEKKLRRRQYYPCLEIIPSSFCICMNLFLNIIELILSTQCWVLLFSLTATSSAFFQVVKNVYNMMPLKANTSWHQYVKTYLFNLLQLDNRSNNCNRIGDHLLSFQLISYELIQETQLLLQFQA